MNTFRANRRSRGFSLAELIVVLVIIIFASTVALLAYSNYRKGASVRSSAEKIKALLVNARTRAIAANNPSSITFDLDNNAFWVDDLDQSNNVRTPKVVSPETLTPDVVIDTVKIGANEYTDGVRRAVFNPDGSSSLVTVNLQRIMGDPTKDESFYAIQMYPSSAEPKVWPNARK